MDEFVKKVKYSLGRNSLVLVVAALVKRMLFEERAVIKIMITWVISITIAQVHS